MEQNKNNVYRTTNTSDTLPSLLSTIIIFRPTLSEEYISLQQAINYTRGRDTL